MPGESAGLPHVPPAHARQSEENDGKSDLDWIRSRQPPKVDKEEKVNQKVIFVRYIDHALFVNVPSEVATPMIRECIGWLEEDNPAFVTIVWDRRSSSMPIGGALERDKGISLSKRDVIEVKEVGV